MQNKWTIVCQNSILDDYSKRLSLINILDTIRLQVTDENLLKFQEKKIDYLYAKSMRFCVVSSWQRQDVSKEEEKKYRISILGPKGRTLQYHEHSIIFKQDVSTFKSRFFINGFKFTGNGIYRIVMEKDTAETGWIEVSKISLKVRVNIKKTPIKSRVNNLVN